MSLGFFKTFATHRGAAFTGEDGKTYLLCNGSTYARSVYPLLSSIWPSGAFGSDNVNIKLPNCQNITLRGWSPLNGFDPAVQQRTALSGILPVGSGCGSFQLAEMETHQHQDSQGSVTGANNPNEGGPASVYFTFNNTTTQTTLAEAYPRTPSVISTPTITVSGSVSSLLEVSCTKSFMYICAS